MNKLRLIRVERGLSQHELSNAANLPRWRIQLIEQNVRLPDQEDRERLSLTLGVSENELFGPASTIEPGQDRGSSLSSRRKAKIAHGRK